MTRSTRFTCVLNIYILLHSSDLNISAKMRPTVLSFQKLIEIARRCWLRFSCLGVRDLVPTGEPAALTGAKLDIVPNAFSYQIGSLNDRPFLIDLLYLSSGSISLNDRHFLIDYSVITCICSKYCIGYHFAHICISVFRQNPFLQDSSTVWSESGRAGDEQLRSN